MDRKYGVGDVGEGEDGDKLDPVVAGVRGKRGEGEVNRFLSGDMCKVSFSL